MIDLRETLLLRTPRETSERFPALHEHPEISHAIRLRATMGEFDDSYDGMLSDEYYRIVRETGFEESWGESFLSPISGSREQQFVMVHDAGIVLVWETLEGRVGAARWYANYRGPREVGVERNGVQVLAMDGREGIRWWTETLLDGLVAPMTSTPPVWSIHHGLRTEDIEQQRVARIQQWPERVRTMLNVRLAPMLMPGEPSE